MADAAEIRTIRATIVSIGSTEQVTPKYSKFGFEYTVAGNDVEVIEGESPAWHRGKLEIGGVYELVLKANANPSGGYYTPSVEKVTPINEDAPQKPPSKPNPPAPASTQDKPVGRRPDLNGRWREHSSHARTAQMQATDRVGQYVQLIIAGKLVIDDKDESGKPIPVKAVSKTTLEDWISREIRQYWDELLAPEPIDPFGNLKDES